MPIPLTAEDIYSIFFRYIHTSMALQFSDTKEQTAMELENRDGGWVSNADIKEKPQRWTADSEGFTTDESNLPKGYYYNPYFLGTFIAMGLGFWAGVSGFGYAAPVLSIINADIGPDPNIQWVALIHPVALSVGMVCCPPPLPLTMLTANHSSRPLSVDCLTFSAGDGSSSGVPSSQ